MMKTAAFLLLLLFYFCQPVIVYGAPQKRPKAGAGAKTELHEVTKKITEQKIELQKVEQQEAQVIEKLDAIDRELEQENREYTALTETIDRLQARINSTNDNIAELKKQSSRNAVYLNKRLKASYKYYRRGFLKILLSSPTYSAFIRQEKFVPDTLNTDLALVQACRTAIEKKRSCQKELSDKKEELLHVKEQHLHQTDRIRESRNEKIAFLEKIKNEKSLQLNALEELENYSKELQSFVDRLPREQSTHMPGRSKFSALKGRLLSPVRGKIITSYGRTEHPDLHTSTFQRGIEIACPYGANIKAVYDGKVIYADWFKGYGYTIIINHGENYYSLMAHASKLLKSVGDTVREGETIALVGDTSSIKGACLYFEIRYHGKPQNPLAWLKNDFT